MELTNTGFKCTSTTVQPRRWPVYFPFMETGHRIWESVKCYWASGVDENRKRMDTPPTAHRTYQKLRQYNSVNERSHVVAGKYHRVNDLQGLARSCKASFNTWLLAKSPTDAQVCFTYWFKKRFSDGGDCSWVTLRFAARWGLWVDARTMLFHDTSFFFPPQRRISFSYDKTGTLPVLG